MLFQAILFTLALLAVGLGFASGNRGVKVLGVVGGLVLLLGVGAASWSHLINLMMPYEHRPERIA